MEWIEFAVAMGVFLLSHRLPATVGSKEFLTQTLGNSGYTALFSLVSLGLLWCVVAAAGRAPFVPVWDQLLWHRWAINLAMPAAILLGCFGVGAANPFAFEGRTSGFDPDHPGIAGVTRQPLLWALALWSGAHLLGNGDLAHILLFAPFLLFSVAGMPMAEARRRTAMGRSAWQSQTARTGLLPFSALITGRWRPQTLPSWRRLALALVVWAGLWHLHLPAIGVWPGP
ncbi:MAG: NnrU family protein [Paracoccaceae bacterium]